MKDRILLILNTLRHFPPRALFFEAWRRFVPTPRQARALADAAPPAYPGCRWKPRADFLPPGAQTNPREDILAGRFTFLNETEQVGWPPDWARVPERRHWFYYMHYLDALWALSYEEGRALVRSWMQAHPLAHGQPAWDPYPVSLRLMNVCGVFWQRHASALESDASFRSELWAWVWRQAEWLRRSVEFNVGGNHLIENSAGLAVAGSCFEGSAAAGWLRCGIRILRAELPGQILADGLHLTRSPMYSSRVLFVLLTLCNTGQPVLVKLTEERAARMVDGLGAILHPDRGIPLFCDSNLKTYNPVDELSGYAARVIENTKPAGAWAGGRRWPDAVYAAHRSGGDYFIVSGGPREKLCIPGHAHGDIFSFEWTLGGERFMTDSGVFDYRPSEWRRYCRGTRAHNTVEIEGADQWEFWDVFRVARQERPCNVDLEADEAGVRLQGRFEGYRRLPGQPDHVRRLLYVGAARRLEIEDRIRADADVTAVSRLHFHPDVRLEPQGEHAWVATRGATRVVIHARGGPSKAARSWYCPEFGRKIEREALEVSARGRDVTLSLIAEVVA